MVAPLPFTKPLARSRAWDGRDSRPSPTPLAVVSLCLLVASLVLGAFWAGRVYEQRTQLGKLLAYAPAMAELEAATRSADSLGMRFMFQLNRRARR